MENKEKLKPFSVKKLLVTIFSSTLITTYIGFTILFILVIPLWVNGEIISLGDVPIDVLEKNENVNPQAEYIIENGRLLEADLKNSEEYIVKQKEVYGEDYPGKGILMSYIISKARSSLIIHVYLLTSLIGVILGIIIYIVSVQEAKGKQLIIEVIVALLILLMFLSFVDYIYEVIINNIINITIKSDITYYPNIFDSERNSIFTIYVGVFILIYLGNIIKQKILANKLNKELNNN